MDAAVAVVERDELDAVILDIVFRRPIDDPHQMGFALNEALAHVNRLEREETAVQGWYYAVK